MATEYAGANYHIVVSDDGSAADVYDQHEKKIDSLIKKTEELSKASEESGKQGIDAFKKAEAATTSYGATLARVVNEVKVLGAIGFVGIGTAALGMGLAVKTALDQIAQANKLKDLAASAGLTTQELTELRGAAEANNIPIQALASAVGGLNRSLQLGQSDTNIYGRIFKELGINVRDAEGGVRGALPVFLDLADRFKEMPNDSAKAGAGLRLFRGNFNDILPVLNMGRSGIQEWIETARRMGVVIDDEFAEHAENFQHSQARIHLAMEGVRMTIGRALIGPLEDVATKTAEWTAANQDLIESKILGFLDTMATLGPGLGEVASAIGAIAGQVATLMAKAAEGPGLLPVVGALYGLARGGPIGAALGFAAGRVATGHAPEPVTSGYVQPLAEDPKAYLGHKIGELAADWINRPPPLEISDRNLEEYRRSLPIYDKTGLPTVLTDDYYNPQRPTLLSDLYMNGPRPNPYGPGLANAFDTGSDARNRRAELEEARRLREEARLLREEQEAITSTIDLRLRKQDQLIELGREEVRYAEERGATDGELLVMAAAQDDLVRERLRLEIRFNQQQQMKLDSTGENLLLSESESAILQQQNEILEQQIANIDRFGERATLAFKQARQEADRLVAALDTGLSGFMETGDVMDFVRGVGGTLGRQLQVDLLTQFRDYLAVSGEDQGMGRTLLNAFSGLFGGGGGGGGGGMGNIMGMFGGGGGGGVAPPAGGAGAISSMPTAGADTYISGIGFTDAGTAAAATGGGGMGGMGGMMGGAGMYAMIAAAVIGGITSAVDTWSSNKWELGMTNKELYAKSMGSFVEGMFDAVGMGGVGKLFGGMAGLGYGGGLATDIIFMGGLGSVLNAAGMFRAPTRASQGKRALDKLLGDEAALFPRQEEFGEGGRKGVRTKFFELPFYEEEVARWEALGFPRQHSLFSFERQAAGIGNELIPTKDEQQMAALFEKIAPYAKPGVSEMRFGRGLALGQLIFGDTDKREDVINTANALTTNLLALGVTAEEADSIFLGLANDLGITLPQAMRTFQTQALEGNIDTIETLRGAVEGTIDLFSSELPAGLDATALSMKYTREEMGHLILDAQGLNEEIAIWAQMGERMNTGMRSQLDDLLLSTTQMPALVNRLMTGQGGQLNVATIVGQVGAQQQGFEDAIKDAMFPVIGDFFFDQLKDTEEWAAIGAAAQEALQGGSYDGFEQALADFMALVEREAPEFAAILKPLLPEGMFADLATRYTQLGDEITAAVEGARAQAGTPQQQRAGLTSRLDVINAALAGPLADEERYALLQEKGQLGLSLASGDAGRFAAGSYEGRQATRFGLGVSSEAAAEAYRYGFELDEDAAEAALQNNTSETSKNTEAVRMLTQALTTDSYKVSDIVGAVGRGEGGGAGGAAGAQIVVEVPHDMVITASEFNALLRQALPDALNEPSARVVIKRVSATG